MPSIDSIIQKKVIAAIDDFDMIQDWDNILVAVSGGKDSLTMLDMFLWLKNKYKRRKFDLTAMYVVPQIPGYRHFHDQLEEEFKKRQVKYIIHHMKIPPESKLHKGLQASKPCQWCTYSRRISFFKIAKKYWFSKLAYGHHMDDAIDTLFLNIYVGTNLNILKAVNKLKEGNLTIIRPLIYVRENEIIKYFSKHKFKVFACGCPVIKNSERMKIRPIVDELDEKLPWFVEKLFWSYKKKFPQDFICKLND